MKSFIISCFLTFVFVQVNCHIDGAHNLNDLTKLFNLNNIDTSDIDTEQLLTAGTSAVKEKCLNVSADNLPAYENLIKEAENLPHCLQTYVNITELEKEIEEKSKTGDLDIVFNKYCRKRNDAITCFENFATAVSPCLQGDELEIKSMLMKFLKIMFDFVCYRDGDHIALFIAEGGPQCFQNHQDQLQTCITTFTSRFVDEDGKPKEGVSMAAIDCNGMDTLKSCMVTELEKCEYSTPANLLESMFRHVKKECNKMIK